MIGGFTPRAGISAIISNTIPLAVPMPRWMRTVPRPLEVGVTPQTAKFQANQVAMVANELAIDRVGGAGGCIASCTHSRTITRKPCTATTCRRKPTHKAAKKKRLQPATDQ